MRLETQEEMKEAYEAMPKVLKDLLKIFANKCDQFNDEVRVKNDELTCSSIINLESVGILLIESIIEAGDMNPDMKPIESIVEAMNPDEKPIEQDCYAFIVDKN